MESKIIQVGTSLGLIIPKPFAAEAELSVGTPIVITCSAGNVTITKKKKLRDGWDKAFADYAASGEDEMLLPDYLDSEAIDLI